MTAAAGWAFATSAGLGFTAGSVVDAHFLACEAEYVASVRAAGIEPGARVLDAGTGSGAFLPWLAEAAGPAGSVTAVGLTPENVALAARRAARGELPAPVTVREASVTALPFADGAFDVVWCANTVQYLPDDDLAAALAEFRRVVAPGEIVALKEIDVGLVTISPGDRFLVPDLFRAAAKAGDAYSRQLLRSPGCGGGPAPPA